MHVKHLHKALLKILYSTVPDVISPRNTVKTFVTCVFKQRLQGSRNTFTHSPQ